MRVLLIEDEAKLAAYLGAGLSGEGWTIDTAADGIEGLRLALDGQYDVIVLDRMLPGLSGLAVLQALRTRQQTPVLMLTALGDVAERIEGLRAGADDYLAKPFSFSELVARLQALDRRASSTASQPDRLDADRLTLADLEMNLAACKVTRAGQRLELTAKEFRLLELLIRRPGRVFSRGEIADRVWDMNFDGHTNVVDVAVRRLRLKLDVPFDDPLLHTVRGMGYVLEARDE